MFADAHFPVAPADVGGAEGVWGTFGCVRTVLIVARTLTSTIRLLETLDLFRADFRIKFVFTINDTTQFSDGVERLLREYGVDHIVAWAQVSTINADLVLSASENIDFDQVNGHVVVLPHGLGFNKYVPNSAGTANRLVGLPPVDALRAGRITLVLTHSDQETQIRAVAPEIVGNTVVTGDLANDRLVASRPLRERYRARLGTSGRRLVLVGSTWRKHSVLGKWRTLPRQLLAELPCDEYQIAAALHPNIWSWYGAAQVRLWFADALDSGLVLIPPHYGWQAALVAADQVVADHGSMSLHAASLDVPLTLTTSDEENVADTPITDLTRSANRLDPRVPLREQLDEAMVTHKPGRFDEITSRVFGHRGEAARRQRDTLYQLLKLSPPATSPRLLRAPDPEPEIRNVTALCVSGIETGLHEIVLSRYPGAADPNGVDRHLVVDEAEADLTRSERAAVLARTRHTAVTEAWTWVESALRTYPGARIATATTDDGCVLLLRGGRRLFISELTGVLDALALGSVGYVLFLARRLAEGVISVRLGWHSYKVTLTSVRE